MKFQAETDLVETLKASIKEIFHRSRVKIFEEVSLGYGIADIVVSEICFDFNKSKELKSLDIHDINVFVIIQESGTISLSDVIELTRCNKRIILKSISNLINRGYIEEQNGVFQMSRNYELSFVKNFAIEAKLKDWKRALKQAYRYKWFAEYSFVVLDEYYSKPALRNIAIFEKYNVGLASVSVDGKLTRHFNPTPKPPLDLKMQMLFSEKIKFYELAK